MKNGILELERLASELGIQIPDTLAVATPSGGFHLYFTGTAQSSAGRIAPGIDVRSSGGYVLASGSMIDGRAYTVEQDAAPWDVMPCPSQLLALANTKKHDAEKAPANTELDQPQNGARAERLLLDYVNRGHVAIEKSGGDDRTYAVCAEVLSLGLSEDKAFELIDTIWNIHCQPPWDADELRTKISNAARYAQNEAGAYAVPPVRERIPSEALDKLLAESAVQPSAPIKHKDDGNPFSNRERDRNSPPVEWLVATLLEDDSDVLLAAPSKFLKTFLAVLLAFCIATRKPFGKLAVSRAARVFYCAGEGAHALKDRVLAAEIAHGDGPYTADNFHIAPEVPLLTGDNSRLIEGAQTYVQSGERAGLFIIDTLNRALNGADEDKASTASAYFNMLASIRVALGCSTLTIHHLGKNLENGPRGSSAFYAGFDTVIIIDKAVKDEATGGFFLTVRVDKQKNGEDGQIFYLHARKVETPNGPNLALFPAAEDDLKRAAGRQVGLRRVDVALALKAIGACPGGLNEWTGATGGMPTRQLAAEIARARLAADGAGLEPTAKEIDALVTILNRGAQDGGPFDAYVVRHKPRQWAIAPGPVLTEAHHA